MHSKFLSQKIEDLISHNYVLLNKNDSIEDARVKIRQSQHKRHIIYFYVGDENERLVGVVSSRQLLLADPTTKISEILGDSVVSIHKDKKLSDAWNLIEENHFLALPVVDDSQKMLGIIDMEMFFGKSLDFASTRYRFDIFQLMGLSLEDGSTWGNFRKRMPWLLCTIIGGILCALVSNIFSATLTHTVILTLFIPLVLSLSESISLQAMTHSLQLVHHPGLDNKRILHFAKKEGKIIFSMATAVAIIVGFCTLFFPKGGMIPWAISFSIFSAILCSSCFGIFFPLFLHRFKLDPKVAAGPLVLALSDIFTIGIYLVLATIWIS